MSKGSLRTLFGLIALLVICPPRDLSIPSGSMLTLLDPTLVMMMSGKVTLDDLEKFAQ